MCDGSESKNGDVYKVGFASKEEWIKKSQVWPLCKAFLILNTKHRVRNVGVKVASDKEALQAEPPHHRHL